MKPRSLMLTHSSTRFSSQSDRRPSLACVILGIGLTLSFAGCGSAPVSPQRVIGPLTDAQSESFEGDFNFDALTPTSQVGAQVSSSDLGRPLKMQGDKAVGLAPPNACSGLIPERQREDLRERLTETFDVYLLRTLKSGQESIAFPSIDYAAIVEGDPQAGSVISAHLGLTRAVSFVNQEELKHYHQCCQLTGSCGDQMISKLYEVSMDARYLSPNDLTVQNSLRAYQERPSALKDSATFKKLARAFYLAQLKKEKNKLPQRGWSHLEFQPFPSSKAVSLKGLEISVEPTLGEVFCKRRKSDRADVIELKIELKGTDPAQELLGYKITTSKQWVDLSLSDWSGPVKEKKDTITCYPGPDALSASDNRCPSKLTVTVFPPSCNSIEGDQDFKWEIEAGVYAPRDDAKSPHHLSSASTSTRVRDQK